MDSLQQAREALLFLQSRILEAPEIALVLGSGMGGIADTLTEKITIPYSEIPHFPLSTVKGHAGELVAGNLGSCNVVVMRGRFHFYEGYPMWQVTLPMRVFGLWGIRKLVLSNAAGGLSPEQEIGEVMWIRDHINLMGTNPLVGPHISEWGERFPDMSRVYRKDWIQKAIETCHNEGQRTSSGIFMAVSGPTYETPAEYRAFRRLGADAVGMSTVPEAIVARQMGMDILAFSVISDLGVEGEIEAVSHLKVVEEVERVALRMGKVLTRLVPELS